MTESTTQHPTPAPPAQPPPKKRCDDPTKPNTDYLVAASVAAKRSELYTDDKGKIDERYKKLDDAQEKFEEAWKAQKEPWENLKCQLERILKALYGTVDEQQRKHLKECWCKIVKETDEATEPVDCHEIHELKCRDLECKDPKLDIEELRRLERLAAECVTRYDKEFDELAGLPGQMGDKISGLAAKATKLEDAIAAAGSDPLRNYVAYLHLERDFRKLWEQLRISAAEYGCKLKNAFVDLLDAHRKAICLQVAVYEWTQRKTYEDAEKAKQADKIIDRVLEECEPPKPTKPTEPEKPCKWEAECKHDQPPKPDGDDDRGRTPKQSDDYDNRPGTEGPVQDAAAQGGGAAC